MNFANQRELLEEQKRVEEINRLNSKNQIYKSLKLSSLRVLQLSRDYCYAYLKIQPEYKIYSDVLNQKMTFDENYKNAFSKCIEKRLSGHYIIANALNKSLDSYLDRLDVNRYYNNLYN